MANDGREVSANEACQPRPHGACSFVVGDGTLDVTYDKSAAVLTLCVGGDVQTLTGKIASGLHETIEDLAFRAGMKFPVPR